MFAVLVCVVVDCVVVLIVVFGGVWCSRSLLLIPLVIIRVVALLSGFVWFVCCLFVGAWGCCFVDCACLWLLVWFDSYLWFGGVALLVGLLCDLVVLFLGVDYCVAG